jgi:hypothetical protein
MGCTVHHKVEHHIGATEVGKVDIFYDIIAFNYRVRLGVSEVNQRLF